MKMRFIILALAITGSLTAGACGGETTTTNTGTSNNQPPMSSKPPVTRGTPLPDTAFKATLTAVNPPTSLGAGQQATIQVRLKNTSDVVWPAGDSDGKYQVTLGNHWLDAKSKPVVIDDGRTPLPADLKPGAEIELPLTVTAPKQPGDYVLQLDIVQEYVAWSQDKGNTTFRVKVQVK